MRQAGDGVLVIAAEWSGPFAISAAIEAGRSVLVAPAVLAATPRLADLDTRARAQRVLVMPELRLRYTPSTLRLRELLATDLGPIATVEIRALAASVRSTPPVLREVFDWCRVVLGALPQTIGCRSGQNGKGQAVVTTTWSGPVAGSRSRTSTVTIELPTPEHTAEAGAAPSGSAPADAWPLEFTVHCKDGEARIEDAVHLRWRAGGRERIESLSTERTAVGVAVDHFARRLAGGLIPVPDLGDVDCADRLVELAGRSQTAGGAAVACPDR